MSLKTLLCVTVLLCKLTGCLSIVGGRDAQRGAWPWMVHLEMHYTDDRSWPCGGSLVSDQWVLTSAYCLKSHRRESVLLERSFARVGELSLMEPSGRKVKLKRAVLHPDYRYVGVLHNDIGLVQLQEAVSFSHTVQRVILPSPRDQFSPHTECWLTGWGGVAWKKRLGGKKTLQEVQVSLVDEVTCRQSYTKMTDSMMCAGDLREGKGACRGDGGAPLVCVLAGEEKRRFVQVGINSHVISYGYSCGRVGYSAVYAHVLHHTQFIRDTIQEAECNDLPPVEACFL